MTKGKLEIKSSREDAGVLMITHQVGAPILIFADVEIYLAKIPLVDLHLWKPCDWPRWEIEGGAGAVPTNGRPAPGPSRNKTTSGYQAALSPRGLIKHAKHLEGCRNMDQVMGLFTWKLGSQGLQKPPNQGRVQKIRHSTWRCPLKYPILLTHKVLGLFWRELFALQM